MCDVSPANGCKGHSICCGMGATHARGVMTQSLFETMQVGTLPKSNLKVLLQSTVTS